MKRKRFLWAMCIAAIWISAGCSRMDLVDYSVKNRTTEKLTDVTVRFGTIHSFNHGNLIAEAHSSFSGQMPLLPQNRVTITWQDTAAKAYEAVLVVDRATLVDKRSCQFVIDKEMRVRLGWRF